MFFHWLLQVCVVFDVFCHFSSFCCSSRFLGNAHAVVEADGGIEVRPQCPRTEGWTAQLVTRHLDLLPTSG